MVIREAKPATCPPSAVIEFAADYFSAFDIKGRSSTPSCCVVSDPRDRGRSHDALELRWSRNSAFLLPNFSGFLTVRSLSVRSMITLEGSYHLRLTEANTSLDAAALAIARTAMRKMLAEIVFRVESEWKLFAAACPTIAMCNKRSAIAAIERLLQH